jgi:hypothetical protein
MNASKIIDALGGTAEVARLCEVDPAAVSQWRTNGIPAARMMFLRLARPGVIEEIERDSDPKDRPSSESTELPYANPNGEKAREAKAKAMVGRMKIDSKNLAQ